MMSEKPENRMPPSHPAAPRPPVVRGGATFGDDARTAAVLLALADRAALPVISPVPLAAPLEDALPGDVPVARPAALPVDRVDGFAPEAAPLEDAEGALGEPVDGLVGLFAIAPPLI